MLTRAACAIVTFLGAVVGTAFGQDSSHSYRSFSQPISPNELNQLLGSSNAVQKKIVSDKIAEMVKEKFNTLSPEQKKRLAEISRDYAQGKSSLNLTQKQQALERAISRDPEFRKAAEELRSTFQNQDFARDAIDSRAFERGLREEVQQRLQREMGEYRNEFLQNQNRNSGQSDPSRQGFPGNTYVPGTNPSIPRPNRNSSDPTQAKPGNPFRVGPGQRSPQTPFSDPSNRNSLDPRQGQTGPGNPRNAEPRNFDPTNSLPNNSSPQNSTGPFGGFSDDGKGTNLSQDSNRGGPNPGGASASGQNKSLPKESIGHRFNRMLVNSVEKAMERKVGAEGAGGEQSFRRLLNKFVDSVSKSNPSANSSLNSGGARLLNNLKTGLRRGQGRFMTGWNRMGSGPSFGGGGGMGMSMPAFSPRGVLTFVLIVGMVIAAIVFAVRKTPLAQYLGIQNAVPKSGPPPELQIKIQDFDEIVKLIDRFTLWLYGKKASWWNSKKVQKEVAKANPELAEDIQAMMNIYDSARYARPDQPVSNQMVNIVKTTLSQLKEYSMEKDSARTRLNTPEPKTA